MSDRRTAWVVAIVLTAVAVAATAASAQMPSFVVDVVLVRLYPVVTSSSGRPVTDLDRGDFLVLEDGRPVTIEYFSRDPGPLNVVLLVDVSASMERDLELVKKAAVELVEALAPEDRVYTFGFSGGLIGDYERDEDAVGEDRERTLKLLRGLEAGGGTAMYDALVKVLDKFSARAGRTAILLFTDGADGESIAGLGVTSRLAREHDIVLYPIEGGWDRNDLRHRRDLVRLAQDTGGEHFILTRKNSLREIFGAVLEQLRTQYALAFTPAPGNRGMRQIEVRVRRPDVTVRARRSYEY